MRWSETLAHDTRKFYYMTKVTCEVPKPVRYANMSDQHGITEENIDTMDRNSLHLLLVDDDEVSQYLLQKMISMSSINTTFDTAGNGREAMDFLQQGTNNYTAVILDIEMPVMNGHEVIKELSHHPELLQDTELIVLTSSVYQNELQELARNELVSRALTKPLSVPEVDELLHELAG